MAAAPPANSSMAYRGCNAESLYNTKRDTNNNVNAKTTNICCCLCIHQTHLTWTYSNLMCFDFLLVKRLRNPSCDCIKAFQQTSRKTKTSKHHHMPLLQITSNIFIICDILDFPFIFVFASHFCELCKIQVQKKSSSSRHWILHELQLLLSFF